MGVKHVGVCSCKASLNICSYFHNNNNKIPVSYFFLPPTGRKKKGEKLFSLLLELTCILRAIISSVLIWVSRCIIGCWCGTSKATGSWLTSRRLSFLPPPSPPPPSSPDDVGCVSLAISSKASIAPSRSPSCDSRTISRVWKKQEETREESMREEREPLVFGFAVETRRVLELNKLVL